MPDFLNGLFFSEILADNAGGSAINVNGQGGANKQDEYVEIQNSTGSAIDLAGYQLWSDQNGLLHTFGSGDQIPAGGTGTVVGTYTDPPAGFFGANGNNNAAGGNGGFLEDGEGGKFDTIFLVDPAGNYIQLSYGAPPRDPAGLPAGFPTGGTLQGGGEQLNSSAPNAVSILRDADGGLVEGTPTPAAPGFVCFAAGTRILTVDGEIPVEDLKVGQSVETLDDGPHPIRLIVKRRLDFSRGHAKHKPVEFKPGSLGPNLPTSCLVVSPQHRILLRLGDEEYLVAAKGLTHRKGIRVKDGCRAVTYYHLIFDQHQIVFSEGAATESFFPGPQAMGVVDREIAKEIIEFFPSLSDQAPDNVAIRARPSMRPSQARRAISRTGVIGSVSLAGQAATK
ncbi:MAG: Hint domain-containing protein [Pseudomonadota bacterium]